MSEFIVQVETAVENAAWEAAFAEAHKHTAEMPEQTAYVLTALISVGATATAMTRALAKLRASGQSLTADGLAAAMQAAKDKQLASLRSVVEDLRD